MLRTQLLLPKVPCLRIVTLHVHCDLIFDWQ